MISLIGAAFRPDPPSAEVDWDSDCPADPRGHDWRWTVRPVGAFVLEYGACNDCGAVCVADCRWKDLPWDRDPGSVDDLVEEP